MCEARRTKAKNKEEIEILVKYKQIKICGKLTLKITHCLPYPIVQ